jgi:hypothetical protein
MGVLLLVVVGGINPNCVCSELVQQTSCVCSAIGCFLACWSHSLALLLIYLWARKFALFFIFFFFFSLAIMLENSDQEVNNDPVHLQVQFLINLVLRTGTKQIYLPLYLLSPSSYAMRTRRHFHSVIQFSMILLAL